MKESQTHNTIEIFSYAILLGTILSYYFIVLTSPHRGLHLAMLMEGGGVYGHQGKTVQHLYFFPNLLLPNRLSFLLLYW